MVERHAVYVLLKPNGLDIMTDARHGHHRNAKDTNVVTLVARISEILVHEHVTKTNDPVTQH